MTISANSQSNYQIGLLPSININKGLGQRWFINAQWQSRQALLTGVTNERKRSDFEYQLNDFTFYAGKKVGLNNSLAGGILFRFRNDEIIKRSIQQFNIISRLIGLRLAHRISTDQTFSDKNDNSFRLRYRLASEIPLNGQNVDPNEFYLKISNEYLKEWQRGGHELEIRIVPVIGYLISSKNKIEFGLDYRIGSVLDSRPDQFYWTAISWYRKF